jgi:hypothetical protein
MLLLFLKEILSNFDEEKIPTHNKKQKKALKNLKKEYNKILMENNHLKRLFRQDNIRIQKTKYLCAALRPAMEKLENQNIEAVNAFLSQPPIRNLF